MIYVEFFLLLSVIRQCFLTLNTEKCPYRFVYIFGGSTDLLEPTKDRSGIRIV